MRRFGKRLLTSGGASIWTPNDLNNKVGWWNASDIAGKSDGDSVTAWPDSYGLLSDATGTGTYKTGVNGIGGQSAVEFNGTSNYFQTGYTGTPTDFFCWVVSNTDASSGPYAMPVSKRFSNGFALARDNGASGFLLVVSNSFGTAVSTASFPVDAYHLLGRSATDSKLEVNTNTATDNLGTGALSAAEFVLGGEFVLSLSNPHKGLIAEVGFLSAYPSAGDLTNLRSYITDTYGIATS